METLFERHDRILKDVPSRYVRRAMSKIDWSGHLIVIKGPKGVGKSTLMQQYVKMNYSPDDRHVLYCSADSSYFISHSLIDTVNRFVMLGGRHIFIDEIHKYPDWSREVKELYDIHRDLRMVLSGSSLISLNDGDADLSRRAVPFEMAGLSFREYLLFDHNLEIDPVSLGSLLHTPNSFCEMVNAKCHPLEYFNKYLKEGYYPFFLENRNFYPIRLENVVDYIINSELTAGRGLEVGNTRKIKALLKVLSQIVPYEVDIAKLSRAVGIERPTTLKYLRHLEESKLIFRLFQKLDTISDIQRPDKILIDNPNLMWVLSESKPETGTIRESFFCNQLSAAGHRVEYGGLKSGDFKIDGKVVVEVGGPDKSFSQIKDEPDAYVAADGIESAVFRKIPLWTFGFLY